MSVVAVCVRVYVCRVSSPARYCLGAVGDREWPESVPGLTEPDRRPPQQGAAARLVPARSRRSTVRQRHGSQHHESARAPHSRPRRCARPFASARLSTRPRNVASHTHSTASRLTISPAMNDFTLMKFYSSGSRPTPAVATRPASGPGRCSRCPRLPRGSPMEEGERRRPSLQLWRVRVPCGSCR